MSGTAGATDEAGVRVAARPSTDVYLAHLASSLGRAVPLDALGDAALGAGAAGDDDVAGRRSALAAEGLGGCLVDGRGKVALAVDAGTRSAAAAGSGGEAVVLCTDTAPDRSVSLDLWDVVAPVGSPRVTAVTVGGHGCGNLGAATELGLGLLATGYRDVLVVTADRVEAGASRFLTSGRTLLSDGAAAAVLTTVPPGAGYRVLAAASGASPGAPVGTGGLRTAAPLVTGLGRALRAVCEAGGITPSDVTHVLPGNLGSSARAMLAMAVRTRPDRVYAPRAAEHGHCYSADLLVALEHAPARGDVTDGDVLLLVPTSVRSWFVVAVEYVAGPRAGRRTDAAGTPDVPGDPTPPRETT